MIKRLQAEGWQVLRIRGSHHRLGKGNQRETVAVHSKRDIPLGTLRKIEKNTGVKLT